MLFLRFRMSGFVMFTFLLKIQLTIHLSFCVIIHTDDRARATVTISVNSNAQKQQEINLQHQICNVYRNIFLLANMPIQCKIALLKIQTPCNVMLCDVQVVAFMAMDHSAFIFSDKQSKKDSLGPKVEDTMIPWNVCNFSHNHIALHPRKHESLCRTHM